MLYSKCRYDSLVLLAPLQTRQSIAQGKPSRKLMISMAIVFSVAVIGCQSKSDLQQANKLLEADHRNASEKLTSLREKESKLAAQLRVFEKASDHLDQNANQMAGITSNKPLATDREIQELALNRLKKSWDQLNNQLIPGNKISGELKSIKKEHDDILEELQKLSTQRPGAISKASRDYRSTPSAAEKREENPTWATARAILSQDFLPLWLILIATFISLWAVTRHDFRLRHRAQCRAVANGMKLGHITIASALITLAWINRYYVCSLGLLLLVALALSSPRPNEKEFLAQYQQQLTQEISDLEMNASAIQAEIDELERQTHKLETHNQDRINRNAVQLINTKVGVPAPHAAKNQQDTRASLVTSYQESISDLNGLLQSISHIQEEESILETLASNARKEKETLSTFYNQIRQHDLRLLYGKSGLLLFFAFASLGLVVNWRRKRKRRRFFNENICPRCLSKNTLKAQPNSHGQAKGKQRQIFSCTNEKCNYPVDLDDRVKPRLRVPVTGLSKSGKTVWRAMFFRHIRQGGSLTKHLAFNHKSSPTEDIDREAEERIRGIEDLNREGRTAPELTMVQHPLAPLLFDFTDDTLFFRSQGLLNLIDTAGESGTRHKRNDKQREIFEENQGFVYFIDVDPQLDPETADEQKAQLGYFLDNLYQNQHGALSNTPIAVCMSKIDLLEKSERGREYLKTLTIPTKREEGLDEIIRCHNVTKHFVPHFFPGWDLNDIFTRKAGGSFLFFPISSLGIGNEGNDFKTANLNPHGILEPVTWLLHMNGYRVF